MSGVSCGLGLLLTAALTSVPARACTGPCSGAAVVTSSSGQVAVGGTLLIVCGGCPAEPGLEVVDAAGHAIPGQFQLVAEADAPLWINVSQPAKYLRWKPTQPLAAGNYRLRAVREGSYCDEKSLAQEWSVPASAQPIAELSASAELSAVQAGVGTRFACLDTCDPKYAYTQLAPVPTIWITPQLPASDPRYATHIARMVAELPDGDRFASWRSLGQLQTVAEDRGFVLEDALWFRERRDEYCVALEVFDIVADKRERIARTCLKDTLGALASNAHFIPPSACWLEVPRSEYEAAFCADNRAECSGGAESSACGEWRKLCKEKPAPDAGQAGGEPDASVDEPDASTDAAPDASMGAPDASTDAPVPSRPRTRKHANEGSGCSTAGTGDWEHGAGWFAVLSVCLVTRRRRWRATT